VSNPTLEVASLVDISPGLGRDQSKRRGSKCFCRTFLERSSAL